MNIVFDHQIFSFQRFGGISRCFYELANRIALNTEHKVEIIAPLHMNGYFGRHSRIQPDGINIASLPGAARIANFFNTSYTSYALRQRTNVNIFHETYYTNVDNCPPEAKRILTVHDMIHEKFGEMFSPHDRITDLKAYAVKRADHIICVSKNTKMDLMEILSVPENKISVVYHGYTLTSSERQSDFEGKPKRPYLLYVGARYGYKNFRTFIRAYAQSEKLMKDFDVVCFGGENPDLNEMNFLQSLNIPHSNIIRIFGSDRVLANLYMDATALIYPSRYEGFGLPPIEAMSFSCPVICAKTSSLPEILGDAAEFFNPLNCDDIASTIERAVLSTERIQTLKTLGLQRSQLFSWERCAQDTLNVYDKVMTG